jgi:type IV secretory pathway TraG/TraD family ATPase VirD4
MANRYKLLVVALFGLLIVIGVAVAGQYVGGLVFAKLQKIPQAGVTLFTLHDYWQAYGDVKAVKKSLISATLVSIAIPIVPIILIVLLAIKSQAQFFQFGNAKFATRRDVVAAGLLEK